jgi:hypothetical protein
MEAASADEAATRADTTATRALAEDSRKSRSSISAELGNLWSNGTTSWPGVAVPLTVLLSGILFLLAAVRPWGAAMRFSLVRTLHDHRNRVAFLGYGFLVAAAILFVLTRLAP